MQHTLMQQKPQPPLMLLAGLAYDAFLGTLTTGTVNMETTDTTETTTTTTTTTTATKETGMETEAATVTSLVTRPERPTISFHPSTKFYGCYWRNKHKNLCGFPTTVNGSDYLTWVGTAAERGQKQKQNQLVKKIKAAQQRRQKDQPVVSYVNSMVRMCVTLPVHSKYTHVVLVGSIHAVKFLPTTDDALVGTTMSKNQAKQQFGKNVVFQDVDAPLHADAGGMVESDLLCRKWRFPTNMGKQPVAIKMTMLHRPVMDVSAAALDLKKYLVTLRVCAFATTTTLPSHTKSGKSPFSNDHRYTIVSAVRSPGFVVGSTQTVRNNRHELLGATLNSTPTPTPTPTPSEGGSSALSSSSVSSSGAVEVQQQKRTSTLVSQSQGGSRAPSSGSMSSSAVIALSAVRARQNKRKPTIVFAGQAWGGSNSSTVSSSSTPTIAFAGQTWRGSSSSTVSSSSTSFSQPIRRSKKLKTDPPASSQGCVSQPTEYFLLREMRLAKQKYLAETCPETYA